MATGAMSDDYSDSASKEWDIISHDSDEGEIADIEGLSSAEKTMSGADGVQDKEIVDVDANSTTEVDGVEGDFDVPHFSALMQDLAQAFVGLSTQKKVAVTVVFGWLLLRMIMATFGGLSTPYHKFVVARMIKPVWGFPSSPEYWELHTAKCVDVMDNIQCVTDKCALNGGDREICMNAFKSMIAVPAEFCGWNQDTLVHNQDKHLTYLLLKESVDSFGQEIFSKASELGSDTAKVTSDGLKYLQEHIKALPVKESITKLHLEKRVKAFGKMILSSSKQATSLLSNGWQNIKEMRLENSVVVQKPFVDAWNDACDVYDSFVSYLHKMVEKK